MKNFFIINKVAGTKQGEQIVKEQVEDWMKYLQDNKVISGHVYGEYI